MHLSIPHPNAVGLVEEASSSAERRARLERLATHFDRVWRFVRRMGAPAHLADDLAQESFAITATNLVRIEPGKEAAYFLSTAIRKVRETRRGFARVSDVPPEPISRDAGADALLDEARARAVLDASLGELDPDLRAVFVLHELEDLTMAEIAEALEIPSGTVASRLRRAREHWSAVVRGKMSLGGGGL